jgi:hypothetical protein
MLFRFRPRAWWLGWVIVASLGVCSTAQASETEVREFTIEIEGKASGQYVMTVTKQDDSILSMQGVASLSFKHALGTYRYSYDGTEHWKDGRLLQLTVKCNDDGKETKLSAMVEQQNLRLRVNGQERNCRWDVWTTSYWQLADKRFHNQQVPLVDNDTGKEYLAKLSFVAAEQLNIGNQAQNCLHFRVTSGPISPVELWYDGQNRLVRQEFTDQGKRVVFVLRAVRR